MLHESLLVCLGAGVCIGAVVVSALRLVRTGLFLPLLAFALCVGALAIGFVLVVTDLGSQRMGAFLAVSGGLPCPAIWYLFTVRWSREAIGYPRSTLPDRCAQVWATSVLGFALTNPLHGLLYSLEGNTLTLEVGGLPETSALQPSS